MHTILNCMTTREALHALIDELPDEALGLAEASLRSVRARELLTNAPWDDEPFTDEDAAVCDERWAAYQRGDYVSMRIVIEKLSVK